MITLNNISLSFGPTIIFDETSLQINPGQHLGICAPNGTGKTTLLACIAGEQEIHSGNINTPKGLRIAYFRQEGVELGQAPLRQELESAYSEYFALEEQNTQLQKQIAQVAENKEQLSQALDQLEAIHQRQAELGYAQREAQMVRMIKGLGFAATDLDRRGNEFSGGWQMKIGLAKALLSKPELLILDEPTNHLDLDARMWLIDALKKLSCTQIIVSHDRYFLDHSINAVAELWDGKITQYKGNYSQYETQRIKRREIREKQLSSHQRFVEKEQALIDRFRYKASKARQVQSRIKALEKTEAAIETGQSIQKQIRCDFIQSRSSGNPVLEVENISKSYSGQVALEQIHFSLTRGEKTALLGPNGAGKSTLMRIIAGQDKSYSGKLRWGAHVKLAYFSQRAADLLEHSKDQSVWDYINSLESPEDELSRRKTLGMFLFSHDEVYSPISKLSGGEKARVLLCSLVLQPCNFLILDEPSNHLDLDTQEILLQALKHFPGTVLFSTHDRYLLEQLADKIIYLKKENTTNTPVSAVTPAQAETYHGDYSYFLWKKQQEPERTPAERKQAERKQGEQSKASKTKKSPQKNREKQESQKIHEKGAANTEKSTENASEEAQNQKASKRHTEHTKKRKLEREEIALLSKIEATEGKIAELQTGLGQAEIYRSVDKLKEQNAQIKHSEKTLVELHQRWEQIHQELQE